MLLHHIILVTTHLQGGDMHNNKHHRLGIEGTLAVLIIVAVGFLTMLRMDGAEATEDCVPREARHYSWKGGPLEGEPTSTPATSPGDWQANTHHEPHIPNNDSESDNVTWVNDSLHFTGEPGKANFFYMDWGQVCEEDPEPTPTPTPTPTSTATPVPTDDPSTPPAKPAEQAPDRDARCIGNNWTVTITDSDGNITSSSKPDPARCDKDAAKPAPNAPTVVVEEEGM